MPWTRHRRRSGGSSDRIEPLDQIPIEECGELLVMLQAVCPQVRAGTRPLFLRHSAAQRLNAVQEWLEVHHPGYRLRIGEAALLRAANAEIAQLLLEYGADVNEGGSDHNRYFRYNWTPLLDATERKDLKRMRLLLDWGADVNAQEQEGLTALMLAAERAFIEGARQLIQSGADIHCRDKEGRDALMWAQQIEDGVDMGSLPLSARKSMGRIR